LSSGLIALIGPNESGKSSVLSALAELERQGPILSADIARGTTPAPNDPAVTVRYVLEPEEQALLNDYGLEGTPRWYVYWKEFDGSHTNSVEPSVTRNTDFRIEMATAARAFSERFVTQPPTSGTEQKAAEAVSSLLDELTADKPSHTRLSGAAKALTALL